VYTSGKWQNFISQANGAASSSSSTSSTAQPAGFGPGWLPWNWASSTGNAVLEGSRGIALEAVFVVLGVGLLAGGLVQALAPTMRRRAHDAAQVAKVALL
jgi:hypothetical protein